jgi:hypothetical protein
VNRRRFLQALGLTGAATALRGLPLAQADTTSPKRLIVFSTGHGTVYDGWKMHPQGMSTGAPFAYDLSSLTSGAFSRALAPLHPHRHRLNVYDGLSLTTAELDLSGYRHEKGWLHAWTGDFVYFDGSALLPTGPSLDQIVARHIARVDHLPSLDLQVDSGRPVAHAGFLQQLPLEGDPRRVWERLFGLSTSTDPLVGGQKSVLDFAMAEHAAVSATLGSVARERLDQHFGLVRQLEQRITGLSQATCTAPERPLPSFDDYDATFRAHVDLVTAAFSCDLTRVATISMGDIPSREFGWGWYLSGDAHNDFAHRIFDDPQAALAMTDYQALHAAQLAYLVEMLESIPDPAGGSLMDHTVIVWGGELADGWHGYRHYFMATLGADWAWQTGRYQAWPYGGTRVPLVVPGGFADSGMPHQHLLVEVARAMGVDTDHVGLKTVESRQGDRIDLTGGLPTI